MVIQLVSLFLLLPALIFSGEFSAAVDRTQINVGESFILNLTLKDSSPKKHPSLEELKSSFSIASQQQSHHTQILNGHLSSNKTWKLTLIPLKEGELTLPAISVETSEGVLTTSPIKITVSKGAIGSSNGAESSGISLIVETDQLNPFKNEPFIVKTKLTTKRNLANIKMDKFAVDDAIVEPASDPKIYQKVIDGVNAAVIEFAHLVTPLKEGVLTIPPALIQGTMLMRKNPRNADPFFMLQGFEQLEPFAMATPALEIEVKSPIPEVSPWLPAKSVKIEEVWDDSQILRVGEPFTRGLKIVAEGVTSNQLPNLNDLQKKGIFKIYADKPETGDEIGGNFIKSFRKEQFTYIPQQSGEIALPEISISWWDLNKNEKAEAIVPARKLQILPAAINVAKEEEPIAMATEQQPSGAIKLETKEDTVFLYVIIAILGFLLVGALGYCLLLQRRIYKLKGEFPNRQTKIQEHYSPFAEFDSKHKKASSSKREQLRELNPT